MYMKYCTITNMKNYFEHYIQRPEKGKSSAIDFFKSFVSVSARDKSFERAILLSSWFKASCILDII